MLPNKSAALGLLSSLAASLCCITPLVAAVGGLTGAASTLSRIEPIRPYLIGGSVLLLGLAWFQKLSAPKGDDCGCEGPQKRRRLQSTGFLATVTILAVLAITLPSYAALFYRNPPPANPGPALHPTATQQLTFTVSGMGCASCEPEVESAVRKLPGIQEVKASCKKKNTVVRFDPSKTTIQEIRERINSTGYTIQNIKP